MFFRAWEGTKTMLGMPPTWKASGLTPEWSSKAGDMPPKLEFIHQLWGFHQFLYYMEKKDIGGWNDGSNMRPNERLDLTSTRYGEKLDLTGEVTV